jgi:long-subunit fatty acid transport protein
VYNTFDQNRLFLGIKQKISKTLSFDAGYMYLFQQKESGYQYNANKTYRLFFYYTPNFSTR